MSAMIVRRNGGYVLGMVSMYDSVIMELHSERSKKLRVFKTVEAALKVCEQLGFQSVNVNL